MKVGWENKTCFWEIANNGLNIFCSLSEMSEEYISETHMRKNKNIAVLSINKNLYCKSKILFPWSRWDFSKMLEDWKWRLWKSAVSGLKRKNRSCSIWLIFCYHILLEYFTSRLPSKNICDVINSFCMKLPWQHHNKFLMQFLYLFIEPCSLDLNDFVTL